MYKGLEKEERQKSKGVLEPGFLSVYIPQAIFGNAFTILMFYIGYYHGDFILPTTQKFHLSARLAYALCCSFPMVLSLYAGIEGIVIKRVTTGPVNPLAGEEHLIQVDKNYLSNTLEQFVAGLTLMLTVAAYTDSSQVLRLLPVYSFVFTLSRVLFRIGYGMDPLYRAVGMIMTFVSNYIMIGMVLYYSWTKGLSAVLLGHSLQSTDCGSLDHQEL